MFQPVAEPTTRSVSKLHDRIAARGNRNRDRSREAAAAVLCTGGSATDAALAQLGAAFDHAATLNDRHLRVLSWIRRGPQDRLVRARFGARAVMLADCPTIEVACSRVERWYCAEHRAFQIANAFGRGSRLPIDVLRELRLLLRLARGRLTDRQFQAIVAEVARS